MHEGLFTLHDTPQGGPSKSASVELRVCAKRRLEPWNTLVPRLCLGTDCCEALPRVQQGSAAPRFGRQSLPNRGFPGRAWEPGVSTAHSRNLFAQALSLAFQVRLF